jgi:hypothetical protein
LPCRFTATAFTLPVPMSIPTTYSIIEIYGTKIAFLRNIYRDYLISIRALGPD